MKISHTGVACLGRRLWYRVTIFQTRCICTGPRNRKWNLPLPNAAEPSSPQGSCKPHHVHNDLGSVPSLRPQMNNALDFRNVYDNHRKNLTCLSDISAVRQNQTATSTESSLSTKDWRAHRHATKLKYPQGWHPTRRISPEAMEGIRVFHRQVKHSLA